MPRGRFFGCFLAFLAMALAPTCAYAQAEVVDHGFFCGLTHPFHAYNELSVMIGVGVLAVHIGGAALLAVPLGFLAVMVVGGALGMIGLELAAVEQGVALSVYGLGAIALLRFRLGLVAAGAVSSALAIFHGFGHGSVLPASITTASYVAGLLISGMLLNLSGIVLGAFFDTIVVGEIRPLTRRPD